MTKFRLQPALNYREILEDRARQALAEALKAQIEAQEALEGEKASEAELHEEFALRQKEGIAPDELALYRNYLRRKAEMIEECSKQLQQAGELVEERREELCNASKEKKVLEKLKEKKQAEYELELSRQEANLMDEIAVQKFKR